MKQKGGVAGWKEGDKQIDAKDIVGWVRTGIDEDTSDTHMHEKGTMPPITLNANFKFNSKMA